MKKILLLALATFVISLSPCFGQVKKNVKSATTNVSISDFDGFYSDATDTFDEIKLFYRNGRIKAVVEIYRVASFSGYAKYTNGVLQIGGKEDDIQMTLTPKGKGKFSGTYKLTNYGKRGNVTITRKCASKPSKQYQKKEIYSFDIAYPHTCSADMWAYETNGKYNITIDKLRKTLSFSFVSNGKSLFSKEIRYNQVSGNVSDGGINYDLPNDTYFTIYWDGDYTISISGDFASCFGMASDGESPFTDIMFNKPTMVTGE